MATKMNEDIAREREDRVMLLRTRDRMEFREIAAEIGADVKNTYQAWKRGRARLHQEAAESFGAYVGEQLATCRQVVDGLMPMVRAGGMHAPKAGEAIIRAMDHEAKLLGLYAPVKHNVTVTDEMTARVKALADELAALDDA
ncbi:hypothetical protein [Streptomyces acidiscabies]|uniref:Uncharacterized protein n=1 Tax=Streptomyces acidiscabies TaxID=42234 RepID=A0AAP6EHH5_9ACTN|nr:hypothetical protein [Streptomyces acidiscabies]MBZ3909413.1 hypothetical protein [Streptomyces acidiscabies]MDX2962420.1 hypothetical protein [Streptomyces acidiscabies]MDX3792439.1 hypothetical protein [Streptomyces acidiscabies]